jgi:hypothetical protein
MQASVKLCSNFFPRDRFDFPGVDLAYSTLDLLGPGGFDPFVRLPMQRFEEPTCELCPVGLRQFGCLSQKFRYVTCHERILSRSLSL